MIQSELPSDKELTAAVEGLEREIDSFYESRVPGFTRQVRDKIAEDGYGFEITAHLERIPLEDISPMLSEQLQQYYDAQADFVSYFSIIGNVIHLTVDARRMHQVGFVSQAPEGEGWSYNSGPLRINFGDQAAEYRYLPPRSYWYSGNEKVKVPLEPQVVNDFSKFLHRNAGNKEFAYRINPPARERF